MPRELTAQYSISAGEIETASVNATRHLDGTEELTGTPTVVEITTSALTIASETVNAASYVESKSGDTVEAGKAVQFSVTCATPGTYRVRVTVDTDATPARKFIRDLIIYVT